MYPMSAMSAVSIMSAESWQCMSKCVRCEPICSIRNVSSFGVPVWVNLKCMYKKEPSAMSLLSMSVAFTTSAEYAVSEWVDIMQVRKGLNDYCSFNHISCLHCLESKVCCVCMGMSTV